MTFFHTFHLDVVAYHPGSKIIVFEIEVGLSRRFPEEQGEERKSLSALKSESHSSFRAKTERAVTLWRSLDSLEPEIPHSGLSESMGIGLCGLWPLACAGRASKWLGRFPPRQLLYFLGRGENLRVFSQSSFVSRPVRDLRLLSTGGFVESRRRSSPSSSVTGSV